jgi:TRAP-type C4-dicarboxylate transport system permease small subunit
VNAASTELDAAPAAARETAALAWPQRLAQGATALCLAVMALAVFVNVVLRYGFGNGIAAAEELSRLLFVWMVFIGAIAAYPVGDHMAFTMFHHRLLRRLGPGGRGLLLRAIHLLVAGACVLLGWGAWQQVAVGWASKSVVMGYPSALLPLPALLAAACIGLMALRNAWRAAPVDAHGTVQGE